MIDMNIVRGILTGLLMLFFIGMCVKVFSKKNKAFYEKAAAIPLNDEPKSTSENSDPEVSNKPQEEHQQ